MWLYLELVKIVKNVHKFLMRLLFLNSSFWWDHYYFKCRFHQLDPYQWPLWKENRIDFSCYIFHFNLSSFFTLIGRVLNWSNNRGNCPASRIGGSFKWGYKEILSGSQIDYPLWLQNSVMIAIQQLLNEESLNDEGGASEAEVVQIRLAEQHWIAEATLSDLPTFTNQKGFCQHIDFFITMITTQARECQQPRTKCSQEWLSVKKVNDPLLLLKLKSKERRDTLLRREGFQMLLLSDKW